MCQQPAVTPGRPTPPRKLHSHAAPHTVPKTRKGEQRRPVWQLLVLRPQTAHELRNDRAPNKLKQSQAAACSGTCSQAHLTEDSQGKVSMAT